MELICGKTFFGYWLLVEKCRLNHCRLWPSLSLPKESQMSITRIMTLTTQHKHTCRLDFRKRMQLHRKQLYTNPTQKARARAKAKDLVIKGPSHPLLLSPEPFIFLSLVSFWPLRINQNVPLFFMLSLTLYTTSSSSSLLCFGFKA